MMAGGEAPDVFNVQPSTLGEMLTKRVLLELDPYIARSKAVHLEDFYPQTLAPYRWDGTRYGRGPLHGICKDWTPDNLIYYNKNLFDQAGIPYPDGSWNRAQFVEIAQKLTRRDSAGRIVQFGVYNNCSPEQWVWESGGRYFTEDRRRCLLDTPEVIAGLQFSSDLSNKWHVAPGYAEAQQGSVNVMFETGRVAMCFYGQWMAPQFRANIKDFAWGVATPPHDRQDVYLSGGMVGYGIYARTPHPEAAWRFMESLVGPVGQAARARIGWNIPSNRDIARGPLFQDNPDLDRNVTATFLGAVDRTSLFDLNPYISPQEFDLYFAPQWEMVMLGEKSVPEAMQAATRQINQAIQDNQNLMRQDLSRE
jgi:multiple sugar transport system substrate-binding protein